MGLKTKYIKQYFSNLQNYQMRDEQTIIHYPDYVLLPILPGSLSTSYEIPKMSYQYTLIKSIIFLMDGDQYQILFSRIQYTLKDVLLELELIPVTELFIENLNLISSNIYGYLTDFSVKRRKRF